MDELKSSVKPFDISKREVWDAYLKVKANKSAVSIQVLDTRKILFCRGAGWGCDRLVGCRVPTSSPTRS